MRLASAPCIFSRKILFCPRKMVRGRTGLFVVRLPSRRRARFFRFFVFVEAKRRFGFDFSPRRLNNATPVAVRACPKSLKKHKGNHKKSPIFGLRAVFRDPYRTFSPSEAAFFFHFQKISKKSSFSPFKFWSIFGLRAVFATPIALSRPRRLHFFLSFFFQKI